jgi:energy-coupling factor transporter transmembrane protein EcfT
MESPQLEVKKPNPAEESVAVFFISALYQGALMIAIAFFCHAVDCVRKDGAEAIIGVIVATVFIVAMVFISSFVLAAVSSENTKKLEELSSISDKTVS